MLIMLINPPAAVDADQEAHEQAGNVVVAARPEHLLVAKIVSDKAQLHNHECQKGRVQYLRPDAVHKHEDCEAQRQQAHVQRELGGVVLLGPFPIVPRL